MLVNPIFKKRQPRLRYLRHIVRRGDPLEPERAILFEKITAGRLPQILPRDQRIECFHMRQVRKTSASSAARRGPAVAA